jgi:hypothetical protein
MSASRRFKVSEPESTGSEAFVKIVFTFASPLNGAILQALAGCYRWRAMTEAGADTCHEDVMVRSCNFHESLTVNH